MTSAGSVRGDYAHQKLFSWLDEDKVFERETYKGKRRGWHENPVTGVNLVIVINANVWENPIRRPVNHIFIVLMLIIFI